jgi:16S rRNA (uracil1498-N3)-methyltransferase
LNLYYQPQLAEGFYQLDPDESQHAIKVLRHAVGDEIPVTDGKGNLYQCRITSTSGKTCSLEIIEQRKINKPNHFIHIVLAPTKSSDRTEWFVEKCVELGIQKISFINTQHSERNKINLERVTKVAIAALKQSGQVWMPEIEGMVSFRDVLNTSADQKFIAYAGGKESPSLQSIGQKNKSYLVLIGPEGDFSDPEIMAAHQASFQTISLGPNTLRTETAGVAACHILNLIQS